MHPPQIPRLRRYLEEVAPYPSKVLPVPTPISGTAFFPGGHGLWMEDGEPNFPEGGIMVLGHDFHSNEEYEKSLGRGEESMKSPTWRNLLALLDESGILPRDCFFTNFFMGLRAGPGTTGEFPGKKDPAFVQRCRDMLILQLQVQRPRMVLVLGAEVPALIAPMAKELSGWTSATLKEIDLRSAGHVAHVDFGHDLPSCDMVALTHPSFRHLNVGQRTFGYTGHQAELAMIKQALRKGQ